MEKLLQNRALMEDLGCCKRAGRGLNRSKGFCGGSFYVVLPFFGGQGTGLFVCRKPDALMCLKL